MLQANIDHFSVPLRLSLFYFNRQTSVMHHSLLGRGNRAEY